MILVTGAGGFIGGHLVKRLVQGQHEKVRAVDIKPVDQWFQRFDAALNYSADLRKAGNSAHAVIGCDTVYNLAANMGGMGYIESHKTECMLNVLINTNLLRAAKEFGVKRYFFSSSACVYPDFLQNGKFHPPLKERDAYPAAPEDGYGWEKLFSERMCGHFCEDYGLQVRVARLHNVYGPHGTWTGGREKAPAALCRKVIKAKLNGGRFIEIWGDGEQTRSFMWIEDCIHGIDLIMKGDYSSPINLGSSEAVTINQLAKVIWEIAGAKFYTTYIHNAPKGVDGRSSDNTLIKQLYNWEPSTPLRVGMEKLYAWIYDEIKRRNNGRERVSGSNH